MSLRLDFVEVELGGPKKLHEEEWEGSQRVDDGEEEKVMAIEEAIGLVG